MGSLYVYNQCPQLAEHARRLAVVLRRRGYSVQEGNALPAVAPALVIAFGLNAYTTALPTTPYIAVQLEQLDSAWFNAGYWARLRGAVAVWDFSRSHIAPLRAHGVNAVYIPFGRQEVVSPVFTENTRDGDCGSDYDILFLGALNARRRQMLCALTAAGLRVYHSANAFSADADALLARATLVLNWHYYPTATLEQLRVIPALEQGKLVISEASRDALPIADYVTTVDELIARCQYWLRQSARARYEQACRYLAVVPSLDAVLPWEWLREMTTAHHSAATP